MSRAALQHAPQNARKGAATSLHVGPAHDSFEQEADQAAEKVTSGEHERVAWSLSRVGLGPVQRQCSCGGSCDDCKKKKEMIQRQAMSSAAGGVHAPASVSSVLSRPGSALDSGTRSFMESRFGYDFSGVRVHHDSEAAGSARDVSANAYTVGSSIVFDQGKYQPHSPSGRRLLAHELAHVVQQSRGGSPPPASGDPVLEGEARNISSQVDSHESELSVRRSSGVGLARDANAGQQTLIEVKFPDGVRQLTQDEFAGYKRRAIVKLRSDLNLVAGLADNGRQTQVSTLAEYQGGVESLWDVVKKPKALIGIAADIKAGVTPPYIGAWSNPKHTTDLGLAACDREDLAEAARDLKLADTEYRDAMHAWNAYREATIGGAEGVVSNLETVRDVSFAVALVAGAAVAAPVIAAGVAATGATGVTATALTTAGTALATGTGGAVLGGGSTAAGSLIATGKVDVKAAKADALKFGKQGLVTGLTAGLGSSLTAAGTTAKLAQPFVQTAAKRCLTEAGVNVAGEVTTELLDAAVPPAGKEKPAEGKQESAPKPLVPAPARAALTGCISGVLGVPVAKLGRTASKASELAVGAGVGYVDARLAGQSNKEALLAAGQNVLTSAAVARGHAGSEHAKATKSAPPHETHGTGSKPAPLHPEHAPSAAAHAEGGTPKPSEHEAAHAAEPAKKPPAKKVLEEQKALTGHEGPPAVLKEEAKAKKPIGDGHEVVVTEQGVGKCSPSPCPVISVEYAKELEKFPRLKALNDEVQSLRKSNPNKAADEAARLIHLLENARQGPYRIEKGRGATSTRKTIKTHAAPRPTVEHGITGRDSLEPRGANVPHIEAAGKLHEGAAGRALELPASSDKTIATTVHGHSVSGYKPLPESKVSATPEQVAQHVNERLKLTLKPAGGHDVAGNEPGFPGKYHASHAEVQQMVARPNEPVGVSKDMCESCRAIFKAEAKYQNRAQIVSDPQATRVFEPDGTVTEYWKDGTIVRLEPDGSAKVRPQQ